VNIHEELGKLLALCDAHFTQPMSEITPGIKESYCKFCDAEFERETYKPHAKDCPYTLYTDIRAKFNDKEPIYGIRMVAALYQKYTSGYGMSYLVFCVPVEYDATDDKFDVKAKVERYMQKKNAEVIQNAVLSAYHIHTIGEDV